MDSAGRALAPNHNLNNRSRLRATKPTDNNSKMAIMDGQSHTTTLRLVLDLVEAPVSRHSLRVTRSRILAAALMGRRIILVVSVHQGSELPKITLEACRSPRVLESMVFMDTSNA